ncbi:glutamic acid-rich protein-like [Odontomachus brunneus]|uniref:glutamic acid-rich protein-like n=1 Tax=Odontomachus brunneus TaxID=486640 RepID=UPI0013F2903B|nr:glutamic acid-rich protein-like [Odontomachus brunneus]
MVLTSCCEFRYDRLTMVSRLFLLALVAIVADIIIPVVYGAGFIRPAHGRIREPKQEVDLVGHGILSDKETGHIWKIKLTMLKDEDDADDVIGVSNGIRRYYGPPPRVICRCQAPNWRLKLNAELSPEEISLKRQLRNLIIEIQRVIAKIKMIEFRSGSLWDCRVYKNPLKEIVIDIMEDKADVEELIARDKKRSRDKHKFTSTLSYGGYPGNTPESQKALSDEEEEEEDMREGGLDLTKSFVDSLGFEHQARRNIIKVRDKRRRSNSNLNTNLNVNSFNYKLASDHERKKKGRASDPGNTPESQKTLSDEKEKEEEENMREGGLDLTKSFVDSLGFEHQARRNIIKVRDKRRRSNSNLNTNLNVNSFNYKLASDHERRKKGRASDPERESNAVKELLDEHPTSSDDTFRSERNKSTAIEDTTRGSNSRVDDVVSNGRGESGDEKKQRTSNSTGKTLYNSWGERDGKYYQCVGKSCKNQQKSRGATEEEDSINPHTNVNSSLLALNGKKLASSDKKSHVISPDDTAEEDRSDVEENEEEEIVVETKEEIVEEEDEEEEEDDDEEDNRSFTNLSNVDLREGQETSTEDNCTKQSLNSDVLINKRDNEDSLQPHRADRAGVEENRENISRNKNRNINYNRNVNYNKKKSAKLETVEDGKEATTSSGHEAENVSGRKGKTTIANEADAGMKSDSDLGETADKCTDDTCELSGDEGLLASAAEVKNPRQMHSSIDDDSDEDSDENSGEDLNENSNINSNVNVNLNRLIRPWRYSRKPRYAPRRPDNDVRDALIHADKERIGGKVSAARNGSKVDERRPNSLDTLIDAVDKVLSADTSATPGRDSSKNFKAPPVKMKRSAGDAHDAQ